jgi:hypothetical protein
MEIKPWDSLDEVRDRQRDRYDGTQFPILFENSEVIVYKNSSDEIFIETKHAKVTMRVSPRREGLMVTAGNGNGMFTPSSFNGLPAFVVSPSR